jgi:hypothetical protein
MLLQPHVADGGAGTATDVTGTHESVRHLAQHLPTASLSRTPSGALGASGALGPWSSCTETSEKQFLHLVLEKAWAWNGVPSCQSPHRGKGSSRRMDGDSRTHAPHLCVTATQMCTRSIPCTRGPTPRLHCWASCQLAVPEKQGPQHPYTTGPNRAVQHPP